MNKNGNNTVGGITKWERRKKKLKTGPIKLSTMLDFPIE